MRVISIVVILGLGTATASTVVPAAGRSSELPASSTFTGAHEVTVRIEALGTGPVQVHLVSPDTALRIIPDSTLTAVRALTVRTPVVVVVSELASEVRVTTEHDLAVRVVFENGATARERAQRPWGRQLLFRRSEDGDLLSRAQVLQLVPER